METLTRSLPEESSKYNKSVNNTKHLMLECVFVARDKEQQNFTGKQAIKYTKKCVSNKKA